MNKSFSGKLWEILRDSSEQVVSRLAKTLDIPEIVAIVLANRGIHNTCEAESFLDSKLKITMPDPSLLLGMDLAVERTVVALQNKEKIFVFGDYDVDGIVSTYLLVHYLRSIGIFAEYHIPDRFSSGYGMSTDIVLLAQNKNTNLFISVDCGVCSIDEVEFANNLGIDSIIIDHHVPGKGLPSSIAVVNPKRLDQEEIGMSNIKNLCAAGVVFLFLVALQRKLRLLGFFHDIEEPRLRDLIGIVAIGTLCDVVEIRGLNRGYVNFSLKNQKFPEGIRSIMRVLNVEKISSADDYSYLLGPVINAAGRLSDPLIAMRMLLSKDPIESDKLALKLVEFNNKRKEMEAIMFSEAMAMIDSLELPLNKFVFVFNNNWHKGIIGIIAGQLKDFFNKPAFVVTFNEKGQGSGSARSVPGIDLSDIINEARARGIIEKGGGHHLAGGFSMHSSNFQKFREFLEEHITIEIENSLNIDCEVPPCVDLKGLADRISVLEPFGKGAEKPIFCMKNVRIESCRLTSDEKHMIMVISAGYSSPIRTVIFNIGHKGYLVNALKNVGFSKIDIVFSIKQNEKYGPSIVIEDAREFRHK